MFLIYNVNTRQALRCHGLNYDFIGNTSEEIKKDLHLKKDEDYIKLNKSCIDEIRSEAFDDL